MSRLICYLTDEIDMESLTVSELKRAVGYSIKRFLEDENTIPIVSSLHITNAMKVVAEELGRNFPRMAPEFYRTPGNNKYLKERSLGIKSVNLSDIVNRVAKESGNFEDFNHVIRYKLSEERNRKEIMGFVNMRLFYIDWEKMYSFISINFEGKKERILEHTFNASSLMTLSD